MCIYLCYSTIPTCKYIYSSTVPEVLESVAANHRATQRHNHRAALHPRVINHTDQKTPARPCCSNALSTSKSTSAAATPVLQVLQLLPQVLLLIHFYCYYRDYRYYWYYCCRYYYDYEYYYYCYQRYYRYYYKYCCYRCCYC